MSINKINSEIAQTEKRLKELKQKRLIEENKKLMLLGKFVYKSAASDQEFFQSLRKKLSNQPKLLELIEAGNLETKMEKRNV